MSKEARRRLYEGMYIISATLSEEARSKALEKITQGITEKGGEIHKVHEMGRKKLAYEIRKQREGYYYVIFFTASSIEIKQLWKEYHLHEDLLRFTTMQAEEVQEELEFPALAMQQERR